MSAMINATVIKNAAQAAGSALCGIAPVSRFTGLGPKTDPSLILPGAQSVVVVAMKFSASTLKASTSVPYTVIRNHLSQKIDDITAGLCLLFEENGYNAVPTGAIGPCNYDKTLEKTVGLISLKNAAYQAGLGRIGKNTLLLTPAYGNMVWLGALITSAVLEPDPVLSGDPCPAGCTVCIDSCPVSALDGTQFIDQNKCWNHAFGTEEDGGEWRILCHRCRSHCPLCTGSSSPIPEVRTESTDA
jgi:epoxyqueuosine reductase QueG